MDEVKTLQFTAVPVKGVQNSSLNLKPELQETPQIKEEPEEHRVKHEEEQLPVSVPEIKIVCVKTEDSTLFERRQTETKNETQENNISLEPHFSSVTEKVETQSHRWTRRLTTTPSRARDRKTPPKKPMRRNTSALFAAKNTASNGICTCT
ncbi:hypothetical protein WMY93_027470 [Mugilogobius chulae]|uniref:Uncharacterized protein n=1 Tax=Mugilogobius chulae TaxID=88201 RepID=A0AAW0MXD5_9GOBI